MTMYKTIIWRKGILYSDKMLVSSQD